MTSPAKRTLTPRQEQIFDYIREYIEGHKYGPTFREIGAAMAIKSPNGVKVNLTALEAKGWITTSGCGRGASRTIALVEDGPAQVYIDPASGQPKLDRPTGPNEMVLIDAKCFRLIAGFLNAGHFDILRASQSQPPAEI